VSEAVTRRHGEASVRDEEQELIIKLRKIEQLFTRPGTDGERQVAEHASNRIRARLRALEGDRTDD
jgi:hypothetical protein